MKIKKRINDDPKAILELNSTPTARLTADIDKKVHAAFKAKCAIQDVKMTNVVEELIRKYLNT